MKSYPQIVLIADDLTGAADAAGGIAAGGLVTVLSLTGAFPGPCDALMLTSESRDFPGDEAQRRVRALVSRLREDGILSQDSLLYKKMDSTLRGHPREELAAVLEEARMDRALVAPAFPAQGRTTVGSRQLVGGVPLEGTEFGREVKTSDLRRVFRETGIPVKPLSLSDMRGGRLETLLARNDPCLLIADAETDADLARLARAASGRIRVFCGSAGLMSALMKAGGWASRVSVDAPPELLPSPSPVLVVAGSRHPRTQEQVRQIRREGVPVVGLVADDAGAEAPGIQQGREAAAVLEGGRDVVLAVEDEGSGPTRAEVARRLGVVCRAVVERSRPGVLLLTGGETAAAVCRQLGVSAIRLIGEIEPGIPHGYMLDGILSGVPVATKAGGFGQPDTLAGVLRYFRGR